MPPAAIRRLPSLLALAVPLLHATTTATTAPFSLSGYKPRTELPSAFIAAPNHSPVAPSEPLRASTVRQAASVTVQVSDYLNAEAPESAFPVDNPGPLLRVRFGEPFPLGKHTVRPLALIGRKQVDTLRHATEWAIDATGARLTPAAAEAIIRDLAQPDERGSAPGLWLVLESDTPLAHAHAFLRRTDTGDACADNTASESRTGSHAINRRVIVAVRHPFLDAPPVELGVLLFGGQPEPMPVLTPNAPTGRGSLLRELFAGNTGSASAHPRISSGTSTRPKSINLGLTQFTYGKTHAFHCEFQATMDLEPKGSGAWFFQNERMPSARLAAPTGESAKQIWYTINKHAPNFIYAFTFKRDTPLTPARRPAGVRLLLTLPTLPGEWPNRGIPDPLDWRVTIPADAHQLGHTSHAPLDIALATQTPAGGWSAGHNLIPVKSGDTPTFREIIRMHYAKEIAEGRTILYDPDKRHFIALQPTHPRP